jgi:succinate-semialdehyde dehydrogenase/glutarate-semialdehyde dehydrogenase
LGNTVVLKHSEICPRSALALEQLMKVAGLPEGVYQNVFASHTQIAAIIADERIQGISFTGSERAGAVVGRLAGQNLKKAVMELGGSDPYILLDTKNVEESAQKAWNTRMENMGQACTSNKRMIVMEDIYEEFVQALTTQASALLPGDGRLGTYAPLSSRKAAEILVEQIEDAVNKGATLHAGGVLGAEGTGYFAPAVLTGVTKEMRAYAEELFGPVAVVYRARSEDDALTLANDSPYGLGAAVFSDDPKKAMNFGTGLNTGMVSINVPTGTRPGTPFGGVKRSGFGRELGNLGMEEFANKRLVVCAER